MVILNYSHPTTLWEYGINDKVELRLITEFVSEKNKSLTTAGLIPITIGFKTALLEEKVLFQNFLYRAYNYF
jgi:hypothetical protein